MRVFVTGASGWIGSAVVDELLAAGHEVVGMARSDASAAALQARASACRGDLDDLDGIRAGADDADAVVHLANKHDWSNPVASNAAERAAVQASATTLVGTGRPFLLASGVAALAGPARPPRTTPRRSTAPTRRAAGREPCSRVRRAGRAHREPALRPDRARHRRSRLHRDSCRDRPGEGRLRLSGRRHQPVGRRAPGRRRPAGRARLEKAPAGAVCTPSPRRASRPARSPRPSGARSTCPSPRSRSTT